MSSDKTCFRCQENKPITDYHVNPARHDGASVYCASCTLDYGREVYVAKRLRDPIGMWAYYAYRSALARSKRAAVPFALTAAMLVGLAPTHCPALGLELDYTGKANPARYATSPRSPTVDRILPKLGYVPNNVQVISMRANLIKQDATPDEIAAVAEHYRRVLLLHYPSY